MFIVSEAWKETYPGACAGFLVLGETTNPATSPALEARKADLEAELRQRFAGRDRASLEAEPILAAYSAYYKRFKKTYHVLLQLESLVHKGRSLPQVAALVEAMFMAELKNLLLTAGHDLDAIQPPVRLDAARGGEAYTLLRGDPAALKPGDMFMADDGGVISSILYGPDRRTAITPTTRRALFAVYAPPGIGPEPVRRHLEDLQAFARLAAPSAILERSEVFSA